MFDIEYPDTSKVEFNHNDWIGLYPYSEEAIPSYTPVPMNKRKLMVSFMMDSSHTSNLITRISVTGFLLWLDRIFLCGLQKYIILWRLKHADLNWWLYR